jgi:hypothetical protein
LVEDSIEPHRRVAENRETFLKENVDPSEKCGRISGHRRLIELQRQIERQHEGVVALADQFLRQRVVAHAHATIVAPGARRYQDDLHR